MEWYYANGGTRSGPVTPVAFEQLIKSGAITGETLVWAKGMEQWLPWSQVAATTAECASSGGRFFQRDMVPYEGKFISSEQKEDFFQRLREGVQQPGTLAYAGFWVRFLAKFIDGLVNWVIGLVVGLGLATVMLGGAYFNPDPQDVPDVGLLLTYQAVNFIVGTSLGLLYYWFFLSRYSATPGKMALGLKVVRSDGSPLTTGRIIGRYFAEWLSAIILGIGYIMAAFDAEKRALHDHICDTRVIKTR